MGATSRKLRDAMMELLKIDDKITLHTVAILFFIADNPGCKQIDIAEKLGMTRNVVSVACARLSHRTWRGLPGHHIIRYEENVDNYTSKLLFLTDKGKRLVDRVLANL